MPEKFSLSPEELAQEIARMQVKAAEYRNADAIEAEEQRKKSDEISGLLEQRRVLEGQIKVVDEKLAKLDYVRED
ncbi:MAG: hypothetical protein ABI430_02230 [Candidatus Taylorbacteria bacterium]